MSSLGRYIVLRLGAMLFALATWTAGAGQHSFALADEPDESVTAGREALERSGAYPWYDKQSDDIRVLPLRSEKSEKPDPEPDSGWSSGGAAAADAGLGFFQVVAWLAIGLILAALVFMLIRAYLDRENSTAQPQKSHSAPSMLVDRVEALPFQVQRAQDDLLGEARRLYDAGNFREAIIYLFSFELLQLDRHGVIRLTKGKTNRQYVREASREKRPLALLLEQTMEAFEWAFFGDHDLPRERFEQCWNRVNEFERLAAEGA